jgi:hypothetical protein
MPGKNTSLMISIREFLKYGERTSAPPQDMVETPGQVIPFFGPEENGQ